MNTSLGKNIEYYMSLNYEVTLRKMTHAEIGSNCTQYLALSPVIKGLMAAGDTPQQALSNLERVKRLAFELMLQQRKTIPEPHLKREPLSL